ncbi:hypothetical protein [uncultured Acetatifactor sp.]|mgnify:FL=1|uniref:hypothetical protein n=1 Tax=uncultured Acetatifactor sp. TaxID=1671927 RepID=UPI002630FC7D|nr:hypothetical protein [uncultured Acetatifactor sp.]
MEEELEALRERYEARANNLEELHRLSCSARKGISETHSQWAEISFISLPVRQQVSGFRTEEAR